MYENILHIYHSTKEIFTLREARGGEISGTRGGVIGLEKDFSWRETRKYTGRWKNNTDLDLNKDGVMVWTGLNWLSLQSTVSL
jgi:hypothetical protein